MYTQFYNLIEKPFEITPDPRFLYPSGQHREAFSSMLYGVRERKGLMVLTGEVGTGKTLLLRTLLRALGEEARSAFVFNPRLSLADFFGIVASDFGIGEGLASKGKFLNQLNEFLIDTLEKGKNALLIIDEAQNLDPYLIEEIRMLMNLETSQEKLLQVILSGQPELNNLLQLERVRQFKQRINLRFHLGPLNDREVREYIKRRLYIAGHDHEGNQLFTPKAMQGIYEYSRGIPRVINIVCDNALLTGYGMGKKQIDHHIVKEVIDDLEGQGTVSEGNGQDYEPESKRGAIPTWFVRRKRPLLMALAGCLILILGMLLFFFFHRYGL